MSVVGSYPDTEALVKTWLGFTSVAALIRRTDGGLNLFEAMPMSAPLPAVVLSRVGGVPQPASDVSIDTARISFDCWASTRSQARAIAIALATESTNLAERGGFTLGPDILQVGELVTWLWGPDRVSDTPRYVVDVLFTATTSR